MPKTDTILRTLMLYSVSTGLLSSFFALASLITWVTMIYNRVYLAFFCAAPSLLFNSLLATLNGRQTLRTQISDVTCPAPHWIPNSRGPTHAKAWQNPSAESSPAVEIMWIRGLGKRRLKTLPSLPHAEAEMRKDTRSACLDYDD
ncbi:hypothetical protein OBBRIDRAFT_450525 [Obba rivulosa]|uniref:DUF6534 domain-containing protein n=1 Tax=Obba rivulosa TaxID=1052685 RepID=A0A8E2DLD0_9APHY|nr:hypothetical protein OBBRIDRAFT_450525 [Obba rivulosa]